MRNTSTKNLGGRPPLFKSPEELQKKIDTYFKNCPDKRTIVMNGVEVEIPCPTVCGLCYYLGFESRQSFYDYEKKPLFTYTIKRARLFMEKEYEQLLKGNNCTGAIFALKNFGWIDKTTQEIVTPENIKIGLNKINEIL